MRTTILLSSALIADALGGLRGAVIFLFIGGLMACLIMDYFEYDKK